MVLNWSNPNIFQHNSYSSNSILFNILTILITWKLYATLSSVSWKISRKEKKYKKNDFLIGCTIKKMKIKLNIIKIG